MKADVVIASFQLLKNKHYIQLGCVENHGLLGAPLHTRPGLLGFFELKNSPPDFSGRKVELKARAQELKRRCNPFAQTNPILDHFFWHRCRFAFECF